MRVVKDKRLYCQVTLVHELQPCLDISYKIIETCFSLLPS